MVDSMSHHTISHRRPFYGKTRYLFIALLIVTVYSYGWRVTEIELGELVRDAHLVKPLVRDLLRPDIFTFETRIESANAFFILSGHGFRLRKQKESVSAPIIFLSNDIGRIGDLMRTGAGRLEARAQLVQQRSSLVVSVPGQSAVGVSVKDDGIPSLHLDVDDVLLVALPALYGLWAWQVRLMAPGDHRYAAIARPFVGEEVLDHAPGPSSVHECRERCAIPRSRLGIT